MDNQQEQLKQGQDAFDRCDYKTAFDLLLPLAEQGDAQAQCIVSSLYWLGQGIEANFEESIKWLRKSAEQNHALACNTLACMYTAGGPGLTPDQEEATKWYRRAYENGFDMYPQEWIDSWYK